MHLRKLRIKPPVSTPLLQHSYEAKTDLIQVSVTPLYMEDESSPENADYLWLYHIVIENSRKEPIKIMGTYWRLMDCYGRIQEVRESHIDGQHPTLHTGQNHHYVNGVSLKAPSGIMSGVYHVIDDAHVSYEIVIPTISLDSPFQSKTLH